MRALALCAAALLCGASARAQDGVLQSADVRVHYWRAQQKLAQAITNEIATQQFAGLPADILRRGTPIDLYIAPDESRFSALTGGRAPDWGAGVAFPQRGVIVVPGYTSGRANVQELPITVRHELAHVALQRHLGNVRVPLWFTEGYATWTAGQLDAGGGWTLRVGFMTDAAPPLDSLTLYWPDLAADARMAYLLSASAVSYLHSLGRDDTFTLFLERWRVSGSLDQTMRSVYVLTTAQFERLWRRHVKRTYGWTQIIAQSAFIWAIITALVIVLFIVRRRRDRARLQRLRDTEPPDEPAYWVEPPPEAEPPVETEGDDDPRA
jgi:hypothetical protein